MNFSLYSNQNIYSNPFFPTFFYYPQVIPENNFYNGNLYFGNYHSTEEVDLKSKEKSTNSTTCLLQHSQSNQKQIIQVQKINPILQIKRNSLNQKKKYEPPVKRQSLNRNVKSSLMKNFIKKMIKENTFFHTLEDIRIKHNLQINPQSFKKWLSKKKLNPRNYVQLKNLQRYFNDLKHQDNSKALRILFRIYIKNHAYLHILTSKKIPSDSMKNHLSGTKQLQRKLFKNLLNNE